MDSEISSTGLDIHLINADEARSVPDLVADVEDEDDGDGHDLEEEVLDNGGRAGVASRGGFGVDGGDGDPDLGDEHENVADEAEPRAPYVDVGSEG